MVLRHEIDGLEAVLGLADDLQVRPDLGQAGLQLVAHHPLVVGDHAAHGSLGRFRCRGAHAAIVADDASRCESRRRAISQTSKPTIQNGDVTTPSASASTISGTPMPQTSAIATEAT